MAQLGVEEANRRAMGLDKDSILMSRLKPQHLVPLCSPKHSQHCGVEWDHGVGMTGRGERQEGLSQDVRLSPGCGRRLSPGTQWALQGAATRLLREVVEQPISVVVRRSPSCKGLQTYPLPSIALSSFDFLQPLGQGGLLLTALMV